MDRVINKNQFSRISVQSRLFDGILERKALTKKTEGKKPENDLQETEHMTRRRTIVFKGSTTSH